MYTFSIENIEIIPKQSIRYNKQRNKFYIPRKYQKYIGWIKKYLEENKPINYELYDKPVMVEYIAYFKTNNKKNIGKYKTTYPDVDNIIKPLNDAIKGILIEDDKQIVYCAIQKLYDKNNKLIIKIKYAYQ